MSTLHIARLCVKILKNGMELGVWSAFTFQCSFASRLLELNLEIWAKLFEVWTFLLQPQNTLIEPK